MKMIAVICFLSLFTSLTAPPYPEICILRSDDLNGSNIDYEIAKNDILFPEIARAQIKHESNYGQSQLAKENNNLFGMRWGYLRETTAIGERNNYAFYSSWQESIRDYKLWQKRYYKGGDYFKFLDGRYATDKNYIRKIKKLI
jgi:uncharacterized FlgJ-related protein